MSKKQTGLILLSLIISTITLTLVLGKVVPDLDKRREDTYIYEGDTINQLNQTVINQTIINVTINYEVKLKFKGWQDIPNPYGAGYLLRQKCMIENYWDFKIYNVTITVRWINGTISDLMLKPLPTSIYNFDINGGEASSGYIDNIEDELIVEIRTYGWVKG